MINTQVLQDKVRNYRFRHRLTQVEFAVLAGIHQSALSIFERHGTATSTTRGKIVQALKVAPVEGKR